MQLNKIVKLILILLILLLNFQSSYAQKEDGYFITLWDMSLGNAGDKISFHTLASGDVNYTWETVPAGKSGLGKFTKEDSVVNIINLPTGVIIKLKLEAVHLKRFYFPPLSNKVSKYSLVDVLQWGKAEWNSMENSFNGCSNLNITARDIPNLNKVKSMKSMFEFCSKLVGPSNINNWITDNVTDMSYLFANLLEETVFNQPLANWNTKNVINMSGMFAGNVNFNQPIGNWNTENVVQMEQMFSGAKSFNQPIGNWGTRNVTNMDLMFEGAISFNQSIEDWNTQNVVSMWRMFDGAKQYNQPIGKWNLQNVKSMARMLSFCGMDCNNYSKTLIGWANQSTITSNIRFNAHQLKYGINAKSYRDILTKPIVEGGKAWKISDDEFSNEDCGMISANIDIDERNALKLFPNPAKDVLYLNYKISNNYVIVDIFGRTVLSGVVENDWIPIGLLPMGLYAIHFEGVSQTFIKE